VGGGESEATRGFGKKKKKNRKASGGKKKKVTPRMKIRGGTSGVEIKKRNKKGDPHKKGESER